MGGDQGVGADRYKEDLAAVAPGEVVVVSDEIRETVVSERSDVIESDYAFAAIAQGIQGQERADPVVVGDDWLVETDHVGDDGYGVGGGITYMPADERGGDPLHDTRDIEPETYEGHIFVSNLSYVDVQEP